MLSAQFVIKGLCHGTTQMKLQHMHVHLACQKGIHLALIDGTQDWHSKDYDHCQVGTHHLVEGVIKEKSKR